MQWVEILCGICLYKRAFPVVTLGQVAGIFYEAGRHVVQAYKACLRPKCNDHARLTRLVGDLLRQAPSSGLIINVGLRVSDFEHGQ
jgi:hypothetical protein